MGRKEKDMPECIFCLRKMKKNIQQLRNENCRASCIEEKLMSFISPSDFKTLTDTSLFPDPYICKSCFNLVNTIDRDTLKLETLIGHAVNFQLNSDAAVNGIPVEQWPEHKKDCTPKSADKKDCAPKPSVRSCRSSRDKPKPNSQAVVKSLPPRKAKKQNIVSLNEGNTGEHSDEFNSEADGLNVEDDLDDDYVPSKPKTSSMPTTQATRISSRIVKQSSPVKRKGRMTGQNKTVTRCVELDGDKAFEASLNIKESSEALESEIVETSKPQEDSKSKRLKTKKAKERNGKISKESDEMGELKSTKSGRNPRGNQSQVLSTPSSRFQLVSDSISMETSEAVEKTCHEQELTFIHEEKMSEMYPAKDAPENDIPKGESKCETCSKTFKTKGLLKIHAAGHSGKRSFKCDFPDCNKVYAHETSFTEHKLVHKNKLPHKCPHSECGKTFLRLRDLKIHITIHTGEKPYKCEFVGCHKAFRLRNQYCIHRRIHTGECPYKCEYEGCKRAFIRRKSLKIHEASHSLEQPYCCDECGRRFTHIRYFKLHKVSHQKSIERLTQPPLEKILPCEFCEKMFSTKLNVRRHINLVHKGIKPKRRMDKLFTCEINSCNRSFRWKSCMVRHQSLKHRKEDYKHRGKLVKYICSVETCRQEFNRRKLLREHSNTVHGKTVEHGDPKTFREWLCFECGMAVTKKQMPRHKDTYHSPGSLFNSQKKDEYQCLTELCGMKFASAEELRQHIPTHLDNHPYMCSKEECKKTFLLKKNLDLHMMVHDNIKPYKCTFEDCDKHFVTQMCLMRHSKVHYDGVYVCPIETCRVRFKNMNNAGGHLAGHRGEDPYVCGLCGAVFTAYNPWARHKRKHAGVQSEKLHTCQECNKSFNLKSELNRHLPVHFKEKPYVCEICSMGYASKTGYNCHKLTHGEKKYFCTFEGCGKGFTLPLTLKRHQTMHEKPSNLCCFCGKLIKNNLRKHKCSALQTAKGEVPFSSQDHTNHVPQVTVAAQPQYSQQREIYLEPTSNPSVHQPNPKSRKDLAPPPTAQIQLPHAHLLQTFQKSHPETSHNQESHVEQSFKDQSHFQLSPQARQAHPQYQHQHSIIPPSSSNSTHLLQPMILHSEIASNNPHFQLFTNTISDGSIKAMAMPNALSSPNVSISSIPVAVASASNIPLTSISLTTKSLSSTVSIDSIPQISLPPTSSMQQPMTQPFSSSVVLHQQYHRENADNRVKDYRVVYEMGSDVHELHGHPTPPASY